MWNAEVHQVIDFEVEFNSVFLLFINFESNINSTLILPIGELISQISGVKK